MFFIIKRACLRKLKTSSISACIIKGSESLNAPGDAVIGVRINQFPEKRSISWGSYLQLLFWAISRCADSWSRRAPGSLNTTSPHAVLSSTQSSGYGTSCCSLCRHGHPWRRPGLGLGETQHALFVMVLKEKTKNQLSAVRYISMTDGLQKKKNHLGFWDLCWLCHRKELFQLTSVQTNWGALRVSTQFAAIVEQSSFLIIFLDYPFSHKPGDKQKATLVFAFLRLYPLSLLPSQERTWIRAEQLSGLRLASHWQR